MWTLLTTVMALATAVIGATRVDHHDTAGPFTVNDTVHIVFSSQLVRLPRFGPQHAHTPLGHLCFPLVEGLNPLTHFNG